MQPHYVTYKNVHFYCFKLLLIEVCKEFDGASFKKNSRFYVLSVQRYMQNTRCCKHFGTPGIILCPSPYAYTATPIFLCLYPYVYNPMSILLCLYPYTYTPISITGFRSVLRNLFIPMKPLQVTYTHTKPLVVWYLYKTS